MQKTLKNNIKDYPFKGQPSLNSLWFMLSEMCQTLKKHGSTCLAS